MGAPAYLRPEPRRGKSPIFQLVNGRGGITNIQYLQLDPRFADLATAKGAAGFHYDTNELGRIREYNTRLAVYFVRHRLQYWAVSKDWPFPNPSRDEDLAKFQSPNLVGQSHDGENYFW